MANQWNRSSSKDTAGATKAAPRFSRGLLAGLTVVVVGLVVVVCFFFVRSESDKEVVTKDRGLIKEVKPAIPKKSAAELEKESHPGMVKFKGKWYPEYNSKGGKIWLSPKGVRYHTPKIHTNDLTKAYIQKELTYFEPGCDRELAAVISAPFGAMRIGPVAPYKDGFKKQFLESLKVPIIVKEDDPEDVKALKRAVIETKIELKARLDAGEDIVKLMNDNAKQMHELALYKNDLEQMASKQAMKAKSKEELDDVYTAVNRMLAERGVEPLKIPGFLQRKLEFQTHKNNNQNK